MSFHTLHGLRGLLLPLPEELAPIRFSSGCYCYDWKLELRCVCGNLEADIRVSVCTFIALTVDWILRELRVDQQSEEN